MELARPWGELLPQLDLQVFYPDDVFYSVVIRSIDRHSGVSE